MQTFCLFIHAGPRVYQQECREENREDESMKASRLCRWNVSDEMLLIGQEAD